MVLIIYSKDFAAIKERIILAIAFKDNPIIINNLNNSFMDNPLKRIKDIQAEGCVTIVMNTHRTRPDNERDPLLLKNLLKNAEQRLYDTFEKRFVWPIMENLNKLAEQIDHQQNLESLILFANGETAEYTRLPIKVEDRVVVDNTFATRDLVRAMHQESSYYVLVLSRQNARLIEAFNDKVMKELGGDFPVKNYLYSTDRQDLSSNKGTDNLIEEFFNRVDKLVQAAIKDHPLPILLATETRNVHHYTKVADKKHNIIGHINKNRDDEKAHHIISDAWEVVRTITRERNAARVVELHKGVGKAKVNTELSAIWNALQQGRGQTLFIRKGYFQSARVEGNRVIPVERSMKEKPGIIDDIVDEMVEINLSFGGDNVFLEGSDIEKFGNLALLLRF